MCSTSRICIKRYFHLHIVFINAGLHQASLNIFIRSRGRRKTHLNTHILALRISTNVTSVLAVVTGRFGDAPVPGARTARARCN